MNEYHWDRFYLHLYYQIEIDVLFNAWSTPTGLASFFIKDCKGFRKSKELANNEQFITGDKFDFLWDDNSNSQGHFIEVDQDKKLIVFSFGKNSKVRIKLKETAQGSLLELKHFDISGTLDEMQRYQLDCRVGWTYYLSNLRAVLESMIDIRDRNPICAGTLSWGTYPPEDLILD